MNVNRMAALGALICAPLTGMTQELNYTFAEVSYVNAEIDDLNVDGDGFEVRGSLAVTDIVHVFASYQDLGFDFNVDATEFTIGAGLNWSLVPRADFIIDVGYVNAEVETPFGNVDDDGFQLGAGVRGRLSSVPVELEGRLRYVDLEDFGDDTSFLVEGRYFFTDMFAAVAGAEFNDDDTLWNIGLRAQFAGR